MALWNVGFLQYKGPQMILLMWYLVMALKVIQWHLLICTVVTCITACHAQCTVCAVTGCTACNPGYFAENGTCHRKCFLFYLSLLSEIKTPEKSLTQLLYNRQNYWHTLSILNDQQLLPGYRNVILNGIDEHVFRYTRTCIALKVLIIARPIWDPNSKERRPMPRPMFLRSNLHSWWHNYLSHDRLIYTNCKWVVFPINKWMNE